MVLGERGRALRVLSVDSRACSVCVRSGPRVLLSIYLESDTLTRHRPPPPCTSRGARWRRRGQRASACASARCGQRPVAVCNLRTSADGQWPLPHLFSLDYLELAKKTPDLEVSDQGGHAWLGAALGRSMHNGARENFKMARKSRSCGHFDVAAPSGIASPWPYYLSRVPSERHDGAKPSEKIRVCAA